MDIYFPLHQEVEQTQSSSDKQADVLKHRADQLHKQVSHLLKIIIFVVLQEE